MVQPPDENQIKRLYSPKIIHRKLSDNKRIEPPLDYPNNVSSKVSSLSVKTRQKYRVKVTRKFQTILIRMTKISIKQA